LDDGTRVAIERRVRLEFIVAHAFRGILLEEARKARGNFVLVRRDEARTRSGVRLADPWEERRTPGSTKTKDACEVYAFPP
jgi:hypothetical protein